MIKNNNNLIKRDIFGAVIDHIQEKEMTVVIGPRQVGKTTLLEQIQDYLINKQKINSGSLFYFNLDVAKNLELFSKQDNVINFIKDRKQSKDIMYLFIDEVQRIENAGIFLKGIYDLKLGVKFVLTGSSSLEIKAKVQEALTGRKKIFKLMPLSFKEYASYKDPETFSIVKKQETVSDYDYVKWEKLVGDFAVFGGYPRVALEQNISKKIGLIEELYNSYLEKDIINFLKIKNSVSFNKLVSLLSAQTGGLLNVNQLAKNVGVETKTLNHYLDILENTFIIKLIKPFFTNPKKELVKMPKVYFCDNGIRNFALSRFESLSERVDKGEVFENLIASELLKTVKSPDSLHYWRSLQKAEVDFVIKRGGGRVVPMEVKAQKMDKPAISRSYRSFLTRYKPHSAFLMNYNLRGKIKANGVNLFVLRIDDIEKIFK
ncbi:ATP-binding protein [Candidatus Parcubacteria bacterium]|nr:ATP-binding protein [Candidatus Parcubacteria bacterium]MCG2700706.1 ATP-binding protein [Candidatus Parcubacteria bacterium]